MSTPDEAVNAQLAEQAAAASPADAVPDLDLSQAQPAAVDIDALRKQLADAEAAQAAAAAAVVPEAEPAVSEPDVPGASTEVRAAFKNVHDRLVAIEQHLGL